MTPFKSGPLILLCAVRDCNVKKVEKLLDKQSLKIDNEWSDYVILIQAIQFGNNQIVKLLLNHGCRVKGPNTKVFYTPLYYAVENKLRRSNLETLELLLKAGASAVDKDRNLKTPLHLAFSENKLAEVDLMLSMYDMENIDYLNQDETLHFHIACIRGCANLVERFIRKGMDINAVCNTNKWDEYTPLHAAVRHERVDTVKVLLDFGADYTLQNSQMQTPLHIAYHKYMHSNSQTNTYTYVQADCNINKKVGDEVISLMLKAHTTNTINSIDKLGISHFHIACASNNVNLVKNFLDSGVDVNCGITRDCKVSTITLPIHLAIKYNHLEIVKILLEHKALDDMSAELSKSLLHLAVEYKHAEIVKILVDHGLHTVIVENTELLHLAVEKKSKEVAEILLTHDAEVDVKDKNGLTSLQLAVQREYYEIVELLLKFKANVCVQDKEKCTPIHTAFSKLPKSSKCLDLMLSIHAGSMENLTNNKGLSIFHIACSQGSADIVKNFLADDVDVNACNEVKKYEEWTAKYTALHFAASAHNLDVIKLLLDSGAEVDATDYAELTPLWLALESRPLCSVIKKLLTDEVGNGVDIKTIMENSDKLNRSVFEQSKLTQVIQLLAERKSNLNHKNKAGKSLLFQAYERNIEHTPDLDLESICFPISDWKEHNKNRDTLYEIKRKLFAVNFKKITSVLFEWEIDLNAKDKDGNTLLHCMAKNHYHLYEFTCSNLVDVAEMMLKKGAYPSLRNKQGKTPFHLAVASGCLELATLFLKFNAQADCRDGKLRTPLHVAMYHVCKSADYNRRLLKTVQLLVGCGLNVDARDNKGQTPLFKAVQCNESGEGTECLLAANCNVNALDENGETPIFIATKMGNSTGVQMLLDYGADINVFNKQNESLLKVLLKHRKSEETRVGAYQVLKALDMHIRKLQSIGCPVSACNVAACKRMKRHYGNNKSTGDVGLDMTKEEKQMAADLMKELDRMKLVRIDTYTSLHDLLMKNAQGMSKHVKNDDFKKYLFDEEKKKEFPHFHNMLHAKFRQGTARDVLLESANASLTLFVWGNLPASCVDYIFGHLSDQDLKNLISFKAEFV